jgi:hypothetical protein
LPSQSTPLHAWRISQFDDGGAGTRRGGGSAAGKRDRQSADEFRPHQLADKFGCKPIERSGSDSSTTDAGPIFSIASMTPLPSARRNVDHAAQADVVVRVDHEAHVGERVLDLLAP